jgi:hypothetical protein
MQLRRSFYPFGKRSASALSHTATKKAKLTAAPRQSSPPSYSRGLGGRASGTTTPSPRAAWLLLLVGSADGGFLFRTARLAATAAGLADRSHETAAAVAAMTQPQQPKQRGISSRSAESGPQQQPPRRARVRADLDSAEGRVIVRSFPEWPLRRPAHSRSTGGDGEDEQLLDFPCYPAPKPEMLLDRMWQDHAPSKVGLLYEKPPKCASSTVAGVHLRVARNVALRTLPKNESAPGPGPGSLLCDVRWSHGIGTRDKGRRFQNRDRDRSFLWTVIREPTSRFVSNYYFKDVSVDGHRPR